jgi:hypothetical protein
MIAATTTLRQMLTRLDLDGVGRNLLFERWREGRLTLKAKLIEYRPGGERIEHGIVAIDPATPFDAWDSWDHENGAANWRTADHTLFHWTDIHADAEEFARVVRPPHTKSGPKADSRGKHIVRAHVAMSHMVGKITLDRVAHRVVQSFGGERGHGQKTVENDIAGAVREFKKRRKD